MSEHGRGSVVLVPCVGDASMNLKGLRDQLREEPFQPFKIITSDGREVLIRHPELVHIAEGGLVYVFEPSPREPAEVKVAPKRISAMHITTLEPVEAGAEDAAD